MLRSLFRKPLSLQIGERTLRFDSRVDFEFALASRTEVPAGKIAELVRCTTEQLRTEASSVRQIERHFVEVLARSIQEPGSIGYLLREMDMKFFSQDHEWRAIMQALARQDRSFDEFKQLALVKYTQYLASRQDVLKGIYTHKSAPGTVEQDSAYDPEPQFRETLIFNVSEPLAPQSEMADDDTPARLVRLPRGESVRLRPTPGDVVEIVLSRHPFQLRPGDAPVLVDLEGTEHPLQPGRNVLGRHPDSDVMIDAAYRDVSRTHAIVEFEPGGDLLLTDLSSHGTFVPSHLVGNAAD